MVNSSRSCLNKALCSRQLVSAFDIVMEVAFPAGSLFEVRDIGDVRNRIAFHDFRSDR